MDKRRFDLILERFCQGRLRGRGLSDLTIKGYRQDLQSLYEFMSLRGIESFLMFNREDVRSYLSWLLILDYARTSISRKLSVVRTFFAWLVEEGRLEFNPVSRRASLKNTKSLPRFLMEDEVSRLISAASETKKNSDISLRDVAMLELIYGSGLRVSEVASLKKDSVDLASMQIRVVGKGSKERIVLFGDLAADALKVYLENARPRLFVKKENHSLFLSMRGDGLSVRSVQDRVSRYARIAGLNSNVHVHTLRHSFATHMVDHGADIRVVQELLGHSTPTTTQIYTHVTGREASRTYLSSHPMADIEESEELS